MKIKNLFSWKKKPSLPLSSCCESGNCQWTQEECRADHDAYFAPFVEMFSKLGYVVEDMEDEKK